MALSEDQKAMLRLLAQREQGYDDLAALMGLSVDEVRAKVKDALGQLEAEGEELPAVEPPAPPAPPTPAAPEPAAPAKTEKAAAKPAAGRPKLGLPKDRGAQAAIGAGLLAIIVVVVLLIVGGGDSDDSGSASSGSQGSANTTAAAEESNLTQAVLAPVDGGDAEGRAIFGRVKKNVVMQVEATGLEPSPAGSSYAVWLYKSPKLALRVGAVRVNKSGNIAVQLPLPTEVLAYVASGTFDQIDISLTDDAAYAAEVARSKREKQLPQQVGESVLRGPITGPAVKANAE